MKVLLATLLLIAASGLAPNPESVPPSAGIDSETNQNPGESTMPQVQKITTFLWFDQNAEEAIRFYLSIFKDSKILSEARSGEGGPVPKGTLMTARFQLAGQQFMALNGGPRFRFTEAISLLVNCETQNEVDELWEKLGAGGEPQQCGWLKDKYGVSWQIVPTGLIEMLQDKDPAKARRVSEAMLKMSKLDIQALKKAHDQR